MYRFHMKKHVARIKTYDMHEFLNMTR